MPEPSRSERVALGARIGRFEVTAYLGEGGMGVVYEARDPDLERQVAVKLINRPDTHSSIRLVREAQALARLQHPNVVAVHEVGQHDGQIYLAMERIDGVSFDRLDPPPATWRDALALLVQAGHGLVAAHAQGLIHRDIKPQNILVGRDGRVRVADFGLARMEDAVAVNSAHGSARDRGAPTVSSTDETAPDVTSGTASTVRSDDAIDEVADRRAGVLGAVLTHGAAFLGTPRYMAPEQHALRPATAASDQFAFCVTVWEAITGEHPFARDADQSWSDALVAGRRRAPARRDAPRWLLSALDRGLAADPQRRHPSMRALVQSLERGMGRRRRVGVALAATTMVTVAAAAGVLATGGESRTDRCASAGAGLDGVWTADVRAGIARAFAAARPYGGETAQKLAERVDSYGRQWSLARIDACRATHDRGEQSPQLLDRRMACFDRSLAELDSVLRALVDADATRVDRSIDMIARLPAPDGCGPQLGSVMPDPADPRAESIRRDHLALTDAWNRGDLERARSLAADLKRRAEELGHPGIRAFELIAYVRASEGVADQATIDATLTQALNDAIRAGDRNMEAQAVVWMLRQASRRQDPEALNALLPLAAATAARDGVSRNVRLTEAFNTANALRVLGRFDESLAACDRVEALEEPPHVDAKDCRCAALVQAMRPAAAEACAEAVGANEARYGAHHVYVASALATSAAVESQRGRHEEALAIQERILPMYEAALAPDSHELIVFRTNLAGSYVSLRRYDDARKVIEPALAARRGAADRDVALLHGLLAEILVATGKPDEGVKAIDDAEAMHAQAIGAEHALHVEMIAYQGDVHHRARRWLTAERAFARCATAAVKAYGADSLLRGGCLAGQADALVELGRVRDAREPAESAIAILTPLDGAELHLATARLAYGRTLAAARQRDRGVAELEKARALFASADPEGDGVRRTDEALRALR